MKIKSKEFLALRNEWYQRLKDHGFEDIEDTSSPREYLKEWHSLIFFRPIDTQGIERLEWKATYYRLTEHFLNSYEFPDENTKKIWKLHSEGLSFRDIASVCDSNTSRVFKIVRKLKIIMFERNSQDE